MSFEDYNNLVKETEQGTEGVDPRELESEDFPRYHSGRNRVQAIRAKCLDCCGDNAAEVRRCTAIECPLWPYRMGTNPFRKKVKRYDLRKENKE